MSYTVTFWGVRGSIPTPGAATVRYGGNTPCVTVRRAPDTLIILDAGSGIRPLGHELMKRKDRLLSASILLTHTHWDHIQGLPFFKPLSVKGNRFHVYGAPQEGVALEAILDRQMEPMVFPVPLKALGATVEVTEVSEQEFEVDGFVARSLRLRHPGTTLGYRLSPPEGGPDLAYITDNELGPGGVYAVGPDWRATLCQALSGVDTLIHDTMYNDEMITVRAGWGHSTPTQAVELAAECGCRRLILFHHEPEHDDAAVDGMLANARAHAARVAPDLRVEAAMEGMSLRF